MVYTSLEDMLADAVVGIAKSALGGLAVFGTMAGGAYAFTKIGKGNKHIEEVFNRQTLKDRYMHKQIVGKSGSGKTTLLKFLWKRDAEAGHNLVWIEIKEQAEAHQVLGLVGKKNKNRTTYFSPYENDEGFNVLGMRDYDDIDEFEFKIDTVINAFHEAYSDSWGAQTEMCLEMATRAILHMSCKERKPYTLDEVYSVLSDPDYMEELMEELSTDPRVHQSVLDFLHPKLGFAKVPVQSQNSVRTKLRRFLTHPRVRKALCKREGGIDFDLIVRDGILICDFHKGGSLGNVYSRLLASFVASNLQLATFRKKKSDLKPTFFYYDEFQNYVTPNFEEALAQFRSFQTGVILSHQYLTQLSKSVREAISGCVSSFVHLRAGDDDYKLVAKRLGLENEEYAKEMPDLTACTRLFVNGKLDATRPIRIPFSKIDWDLSKEIRKDMEEKLHVSEQTWTEHPIIDIADEMGERGADGKDALQGDEVSRTDDTLRNEAIGGHELSQEPVVLDGKEIFGQILHLDEGGTEGSGSIPE